MQKMKNTTWIAVLCVFCAILASGIYNTVQKEQKVSEEISVVSEVTPSPAAENFILPTPLAVPKSVENAVPEKKESPAIIKNEPVAAVSASNAFLLPTSGEMTTPFSDQTLIYFPALCEWRCHLAIDFTPLDSDKVFSVQDGTVEKIFEDHLYGTTICIRHDDTLKSYYASLSETSVEEGATVSAGTEIGKMGVSAAAEEGVHLHFYMEKDKMPINPFGNKE